MKYLVLSEEQLEQLCTTENPKEAYELADALDDARKVFIFEQRDTAVRKRLVWASTQVTKAKPFIGIGKRNYKRWSEDEKQQVLRDHKNGLSYKQIAARYGRTAKAISNVVHKASR